MIWDEKRQRILLRDGRSVVSPWTYGKMLLKGEDTTALYALESDDSEKFDIVYGGNISSDVEEICPVPEDESHTEEDIDAVISIITSSPRYEESMMDRVEKEIEFFDRTNNILFLLKCVDLVDKMKKNNVVWGVGRGSSCASIIMYIIEVNDINPLLFDIPFSEFSKEQENLYG